MTRSWYAGKVRRNLVDMHIESWDERFLSAFDPIAYVRNLKAARVQAAMVYANSHVGWCYWPTRVGAMHPGLKGRNIDREVFDLCHASGMDVILYFSLIFDNWAYDHVEGSRIRDASGRASREPPRADPSSRRPDPRGMRYGLCCPNSESYRRYVERQVEDFSSQLDFEGVFFDMTFWPVPCYCPACAARYAREVGGPIPTVVDWRDPAWRTFQGKREEWLAEFGAFATAAVRRCTPTATVNHQYSTAQASWMLGVTEREREFCDYLGGDFYEDFSHQIFFCKLFRSISPSLPYEFHTSRCTDLSDHTTMKSMDELRVMNALTFAHQGATLFIDAIDPVGAMNPDVYQRFGKVFEDTLPLEPHLGGTPREDVVIYYSMESKMDVHAKPVNVTANPSEDAPHCEAAKRASVTLSHAHVPYGVIGRSTLPRLGQQQILVLPGLQVMSPSEADTIRAWVHAGGALYASGLAAAEQLGDVVGVRPQGMFPGRVGYLSPTALGLPLMPDVGTGNPLMISVPMVKAEALDPEETAARVILPYTEPDDPSTFASIHSNPPGRPTDFTGLVSRSFGKGRVIWCAAPIETHGKSSHRAVFCSLIKSLGHGAFTYELIAPPAVEAIVYDQIDARKVIVYLVNVQELLPPAPIYNIRVRLRADSRPVKEVRLLPSGPHLAFTENKDWLEFAVPRLDILSMASVTYQ